MSRATHAEQIIALLSRWPGLDDDEIAGRLRISPRQTVNQVCRRLADSGVLSRAEGSGGKIINTLCGGAPGGDLDGHFLVEPRSRAAKPASPGAEAPSGSSLVPQELAATLVVVPCSGRKAGDANAERPDRIASHLPVALSEELLQARRAVAERIVIDESALVPAWRRYDGSLYQRGRAALERLDGAGCHIAILSGGYGVVLAREPIGDYDAALNIAWWPGRLLQRVLVSYARAHRLTSVRAFAAATTDYAKLLRSISWRGEGVEDALLVSPEIGRGGMVKAPASLGEALTALDAGELGTNWRSSYGLGLHVQAL